MSIENPNQSADRGENLPESPPENSPSEEAPVTDTPDTEKEGDTASPIESEESQERIAEPLKDVEQGVEKDKKVAQEQARLAREIAEGRIQYRHQNLSDEEKAVLVEVVETAVAEGRTIRDALSALETKAREMASKEQSAEPEKPEAESAKPTTSLPEEAPATDTPEAEREEGTDDQLKTEERVEDYFKKAKDQGKEWQAQSEAVKQEDRDNLLREILSSYPESKFEERLDLFGVGVKTLESGGDLEAAKKAIHEKAEEMEKESNDNEIKEGEVVEDSSVSPPETPPELEIKDGEVKETEKGTSNDTTGPTRETEPETDPTQTQPKPDQEKEKSDGEKAWEDLSDEEKESRLRERADLKEFAKGLRKSRANLAILERKSSGLLLGKRYKKEYEEALTDYNEKRAEYIGAKTRRYVRERQRMAEQKAKSRSGLFETVRAGYDKTKEVAGMVAEKGLGKEEFEKIKERWRWLGEQSVEKLTRGSKLEAKTTLGRLFQRSSSLRLGATTSLLGASAFLGMAATPPGMAIYSLRRIWSGVGTTFSSYDLMKIASDRKFENEFGEVSKETLQEKSPAEIERMIANLNARAMFSGKRMVRGKRYSLLKEAYEQKIKEGLEGESTEGAKFKPEYLEKVDDYIREREKNLRSKERKIKAGATGLGLAVGNSSLLARFWSETPGVEEFSPETVQEQIENGPIVSQEGISEAEQEAGTLPTEVLDSANETPVDVEVQSDTPPEATPSEADKNNFNELSESDKAKVRAQLGKMTAEERAEFFSNSEQKNKVIREILGETDGGTPEITPSEATPPEATPPEVTTHEAGADTTEAEVDGDTPETVEVSSHIESVKKGEGLWHVAKRIVENGDISNEQFAEAWFNSASRVELLSGEPIHISEAGLVHEGDQVIYVPETEDVEAHFEVRDYTKDTLHVGSNEELAEAFDKAEKERPEWLQNALANSSEEAGEALEEAGKDTVLESSTEAVDTMNQSQVDLTLKTEAEARGVPVESLNEALAEEKEVVEQAVEGKLDLAETGVENLSWGNVEFVTNSRGEIVDYISNEKLSPANRERFMDKAVNQILKKDYDKIITEDISEGFQKESADSVLSRKITQAREAAWDISKLQEAMNKFGKNTKPWLFIRSEIQKIITPTGLVGEGMTVYNGNLLNTKIFNEVNLPQ